MGAEYYDDEYMSHPSRGAWIEIPMHAASWTTYAGRTPRGVRGLKLIGSGTNWEEGAVAPLAGCVD